MILRFLIILSFLFAPISANAQVDISPRILNSSIYFAKQYPGADDCAKTNAAIAAAMAAGGGTVWTPGAPGITAVCTTQIPITFPGGISPTIHLMINEVIKWTGAPVAHGVITVDNTDGGNGGPNIAIECTTPPPTYNIVYHSVNDGLPLVTGIDYEPNAAGGYAISFGTAITSNIAGSSVRNCSFMQNGNSVGSIVCIGINCNSNYFEQDSGWATAPSSKPSGAFITVTGFAMGSYNRIEMRRDFSQDFGGGTINFNASGSGGVGVIAENNVCFGALGSCFNFNSVTDLTLNGNVDFFSVLGTNQGAYQITNGNYIFVRDNHVDSVISAPAATGTSQLMLVGVNTAFIHNNTWNGDTVPGDPKTNFPVYGISIDNNSYQIDIVDACANVQSYCVFNNGGQVHFYNTTASSNAPGFAREPGVSGITQLLDYIGANPGTGFGAFTENLGYALFDGMSTFSASSGFYPFASGSMSFEISFKSTSTVGGMLAVLAPRQNPFTILGQGQLGLMADTLGHLTFRYASGGSNDIVTAGTYADGTCHRVIGTVAPSGAVLYADGASVGSNATAPVYLAGAGYWINGAGPSTAIGLGNSVPYWTGQIDSFAVWNVALTAGQVSGITETCPSSTHVVGAGSISALNPTFQWGYDSDANAFISFGMLNTGSISASNGIDIGTVPLKVASLPTCNTAALGKTRTVNDSTAVAAEGQTCAGSSTHGALAVCGDGSVWKCF